MCLHATMIRWFLLQNRAGKTRLAKYYVPMSDADKRKVEYETFRTLTSRDSKWGNFVEVWKLNDSFQFCMWTDVPCLG